MLLQELKEFTLPSGTPSQLATVEARHAPSRVVRRTFLTLVEGFKIDARIEDPHAAIDDSLVPFYYRPPDRGRSNIQTQDVGIHAKAP